MSYPDQPDAQAELEARVANLEALAPRARCPKCGDGVLYVVRSWGEGEHVLCLAPHCGFSESRPLEPAAELEPGYSLAPVPEQGVPAPEQGR